ncbi:methyltransferase domain-containing protein [Paenibacillus filicis]|uniref:Methyltransferase domain-containing protein n=1 Tax=Paenibacillus gyeongsangnamensis TaxID=3388067 RepID=A0ABT4QB58_9BACL|nr:class I SAM-dependent methyltransferase [Paenibacillus filicis]MCZ8514118.1 methyltransferase domain-containing protein [Paenibacillus filicis]
MEEGPPIKISELSARLEVRDYLEMQRSAMFVRWMELRETLLLLDEMIARTAEQPASASRRWVELADRSRGLSSLREAWVDRWNFDALSERWDQPEGGRTMHLPSAAEHERVLEAAAARLSPQPGEAGLDAGTGDGAFAAKLARPGVAMTGMDQSRSMLRRCRERVPGIETRYGNLLAVPCLDGRFDFIATSFALHHLTPEQQPLALAELTRVLKSRGRIALVDWMDGEGTAEGEGYATRNEPGEAFPSAEGLSAWFRAQGFAADSERLTASGIHLVLAFR